MSIGNTEYSEIIITASDGTVLAVISDEKIIEKNGVAVVQNP